MSRRRQPPTRRSPRPELRLVLSSGTGPVEVRRFVGELGPALEEVLARRGLTVASVSVRGEGEEPASVGIALSDRDDLVEGCLEDLLGTHLLVSSERGKGARKRWFAHVGLQRRTAAQPVTIELSDVELSACRAGGPGGQHVNTTETAVRARHIPSGLQVRASGERSRAANRKAALARLAELLADEQQARGARERRRAWRVHHQLERGHPVVVWTRDRKGRLRSSPRL